MKMIVTIEMLMNIDRENKNLHSFFQKTISHGAVEKLRILDDYKHNSKSFYKT